MSKHGRSERIVVDLIDSGRVITGDDDGAGEPAAPPRSGAGEVWGDLGTAVLAGVMRVRGWVTRHRRVSLVATGTAAAVVLTFAGVGTARENERIDLLRAAPGGVVSLAGPPAEAWRYEPGRDLGLQRPPWGGVTGGVVLDGRLVMLEGTRPEGGQPDPFAPGYTPWAEADVVALDVDSGTPAWRVPLGARPECTELDGSRFAQVNELLRPERITCVAGAPEERRAVVIGAGGVVGVPRALSPGDAERHGEPQPGPEGLVLRARFEGEAPRLRCEETEMEGVTCEVVGDAPERRAVVRAEDAVTGDERWTRTVRWNSRSDLYGCLPTSYLEVDTDLTRPDPDVLDVVALGEQIQVIGCGVEAYFTADGGDGATAVLPVGQDHLSISWEYTAQDAAGTGTVRTADGTKLFDTRDIPATIETTDGRPADVVLLMTHDGRLTARRLDGSRAWPGAPRIMNEGAIGTVNARVDGVVVMDNHDGPTVARDLRDAAELWRWNPFEAELGTAVMRSTSFTDGRTLLLVYVTSSDVVVGPDGAERLQGPAELVALDVRTGRERWRTSHDDATWLAAEGRLVSITDDGVLVGHDG